MGKNRGMVIIALLIVFNYPKLQLVNVVSVHILLGFKDNSFNGFFNYYNVILLGRPYQLYLRVKPR